MILMVGDPSDPVLSRVLGSLHRCAHPVALFDTRQSSRYVVRTSHRGDDKGMKWHLFGNGLVGRRPVRAVIARGGLKLSRRDEVLSTTAFQISRMLELTNCPIANRPSGAAGNFAKVLQSRRLAASGLTVPPTLLTGQPLEALRFVVRHGGKVMVKGISSFRTLPEAVGKRHLESLVTLRSCPAMFQKIVRGDEFRLSVIGQQALVSMRNDGTWIHRKATEVLPPELVNRCSQFVAHCGLVVGGFDLIRDASGECHVLELNPNPLITYYERSSAPVLTQVLCAEVIALAQEIGDIWV